jgi:DeoR family glycerol-3-phosphate regulon repressor
MRHSKRHAEILSILRDEGTCGIADLAQRLGVSLETIRRDVKPLTQSGKIVKMHGAVTLPFRVAEAPFERRMRENADAKRAIAVACASRIKDGDSIMMDTGTTTSFLARQLLRRRDLTVVTNSSDVARTLATVNGNKVFMAGGELRGDNGAAFGRSAIDFVARFKVKFSIISIGAIGAATGPMDFDLDEAEFANVVLTCGEQAIIVSDHSKFGRQGLIKVCDYETVDLLITDEAPPADIGTTLRDADVEVEVAATPMSEQQTAMA